MAEYYQTLRYSIDFQRTHLIGSETFTAMLDAAFGRSGKDATNKPEMFYNIVGPGRQQQLLAAGQGGGRRGVNEAAVSVLQILEKVVGVKVT